MKFVLWVGAVSTAVVALMSAARRLFQAGKTVYRIHELLERELTNNGGSTIKDKTDRIDEILAKLSGLEDRIKRLEESNGTDS